MGAAASEGRRSRGITALGAFCAFGALMASLSIVSLLDPGGALEPMWRINPTAHEGFRRMGPWALVLLFGVASMCLVTGWGLWMRAPWGRRLAILCIGGNAIGDATTAWLRGDPRTLIGVPLAIAIVAYLCSAGVRSEFDRRA